MGICTGIEQLTVDLAEILRPFPVVLAPMAGISDLPFRQLVSRFGASLVVSEMVASQEMVQARHNAREKAELGLNEGQTAVQLAGRDPYWMAEAARMVEAGGARLIDINMGCPAKKVVNGASGSALMRDLDHARRLIDAVVSAVSVPVTLKMRLGWDDGTRNAPDLARSAEASGIRMITVHGRTRCQFYKSTADWAAIGDTVQATLLPVLANGDIGTAAKAREALRASGANGVMIGRAARGRPWLISQIADDLRGHAPRRAPEGAALVDLVRSHLTDILSFYGTSLGVRVARKHMGWYMDVARTPKALRREVLTEESPARVHGLLGLALDMEPMAGPA